ncbi:uncharacterized protein FIBRA_00450 [Fibroporia radiculosa]|uniref:Uncharacterized protein n=1 Tax=Fibroporia radiculosa TaxID=599839 RepID=J4HRM4_9APHY|nr:uncharacterized protein FIBRA_00450 [Fibroporia radiculosa]CCL98452.1 predicted protein [Fibroporia radiculosa]
MCILSFSIVSKDYVSTSSSLHYRSPPSSLHYRSPSPPPVDTPRTDKSHRGKALFKRVATVFQSKKGREVQKKGKPQDADVYVFVGDERDDDVLVNSPPVPAPACVPSRPTMAPSVNVFVEKSVNFKVDVDPTCLSSNTDENANNMQEALLTRGTLRAPSDQVLSEVFISFPAAAEVIYQESLASPRYVPGQRVTETVVMGARHIFDKDGILIDSIPLLMEPASDESDCEEDELEDESPIGRVASAALVADSYTPVFNRRRATRVSRSFIDPGNASLPPSSPGLSTKRPAESEESDADVSESQTGMAVPSTDCVFAADITEPCAINSTEVGISSAKGVPAVTTDGPHIFNCTEIATFPPDGAPAVSGREPLARSSKETAFSEHDTAEKREEDILAAAFGSKLDTTGEIIMQESWAKDLVSAIPSNRAFNHAVSLAVKGSADAKAGPEISRSTATYEMGITVVEPAASVAALTRFEAEMKHLSTPFVEREQTVLETVVLRKNEECLKDLDTDLEDLPSPIIKCEVAVDATECSMTKHEEIAVQTTDDVVQSDISAKISVSSAQQTDSPPEIPSPDASKSLHKIVGIILSFVAEQQLEPASIRATAYDAMLAPEFPHDKHNAPMFTDSIFLDLFELVKAESEALARRHSVVEQLLALLNLHAPLPRIQEQSGVHDTLTCRANFLQFTSRTLVEEQAWHKYMGTVLTTVAHIALDAPSSVKYPTLAASPDISPSPPPEPASEIRLTLPKESVSPDDTNNAEDERDIHIQVLSQEAQRKSTELQRKLRTMGEERVRHSLDGAAAFDQETREVLRNLDQDTKNNDSSTNSEVTKRRYHSRCSSTTSISLPQESNKAGARRFSTGDRIRLGRYSPTVSSKSESPNHTCAAAEKRRTAFDSWLSKRAYDKLVVDNKPSASFSPTNTRSSAPPVSWRNISVNRTASTSALPMRPPSTPPTISVARSATVETMFNDKVATPRRSTFSARSKQMPPSSPSANFRPSPTSTVRTAASTPSKGSLTQPVVRSPSKASVIFTRGRENALPAFPRPTGRAPVFGSALQPKPINLNQTRGTVPIGTSPAKYRPRSSPPNTINIDSPIAVAKPIRNSSSRPVLSPITNA